MSRARRVPAGIGATCAAAMTAACVAVFVHLLVVIGAFDRMPRSPYEAHNVCFVRDTPGATSRFVTFTPVTCSEPRRLLGEPAGADLASLRFADVDGDGGKEAIIESSRYKCRYGGLGCYGPARIVMKVCPTCAGVWSLREQVKLDELARQP